MGRGRSFVEVWGGIWAGGRGGSPPATHAGLSHTTRQCTHSSRHMISPLWLPFSMAPLSFNPLAQATASLGENGAVSPKQGPPDLMEKTGERTLNQEGRAKRTAGGSTGGPSVWAEGPGVL